MSSEKKAEVNNLNMSRNLLIPAILIHLKDVNTHGYELMKLITKFGVESIDKGNFYRTLRKLENENIINSTWDTTSTGPAKRIYSLTEVGETYLDIWGDTLNKQQQILKQFFKLYNPFLSEDYMTDKKEE